MFFLRFTEVRGASVLATASLDPWETSAIQGCLSSPQVDAGSPYRWV